MQATVIALYGPKPDGFRSLILQCQEAVEQIVGSHFRRYDIHQIHGTLIGLECDERHPRSLRNRNYRVYRQVDVTMNFDGLLQYLRRVFREPLHIQFGGFQDRDYEFTSRSAGPYSRSFSLQGNNVVMIGWPRCNPSIAKPASWPLDVMDDVELYPNVLHEIRKGAQRYGVLHAYHQSPADIDNDFFLRIGLVDDGDTIDSSTIARVHDTLRRTLALRPPLVLTIDLCNVFVAFYEADELPLASTRAFPLSDALLNAELIGRQYSFKDTS